MLSFITQKEEICWNCLIFFLEKWHNESSNTRISVGTFANAIVFLVKRQRCRTASNSGPLLERVATICVTYWETQYHIIKTDISFLRVWQSVLTLTLNLLEYKKKKKKNRSSLLRPTTAWRKLSLDIRGSQDERITSLSACLDKIRQPREADCGIKRSSLLKIIMKGLEDTVKWVD